MGLNEPLFENVDGQNDHVSKLNKVQKAWGEEIILHNQLDYCFKILRFKKGGKFSFHFHLQKNETWYVNKGSFYLYYIDTENADKHTKYFYQGMTVEIPKGTPHQLEAIEESEIFEASTMHYNYDSYRIEKGDSQK